MNFSQLQFVQATAACSSFSRAARLCHVTQPTLSNGISKLEEELGEKIFFRTTRTVKLTDFGESLLPPIASMLSLKDMIYLSAKEFSNPETVVLKIGMSPLVSTKFISLLTSSYKTQYSGHEILLIEENLDSLEKKLTNHEVDLILIPVLNRVSVKNSIPLYEEALFFIDKDESASARVALNDIRDKTFVMVPDSCGLSDITRALLRTTRSEMREYEGKALSYQVLADWACHGLGSAILPKSKILPTVLKQEIFKSGKPATISFEARWSSKDNPSLKKMIAHFKKNIKHIVAGMAD